MLAVCRIPLYSPEYTYPPSSVRTNQEAFQEIEGGGRLGKEERKVLLGKEEEEEETKLSYHV